jgi:hypothetical protein
MFNGTILHNQPVDWRVPIATGLLAGGATLLEKIAPEMTVIIAWTGLITILLTRVDPKVPSITESVLGWWESTRPPPNTGTI